MRDMLEDSVSRIPSKLKLRSIKKYPPSKRSYSEENLPATLENTYFDKTCITYTMLFNVTLITPADRAICHRREGAQQLQALLGGVLKATFANMAMYS